MKLEKLPHRLTICKVADMDDIDLKTEADLHNALNKKFADVTKIIIAQRIASVKKADRIIVLDNGSISDIGTHDELIKTSEIYKDIYNSQLKGDNTNE